MKKALPYIIGAAVLITIGVLVITRNPTGKRSFDDRVTLRQKDKIPYGTAVARELLPASFPSATILSENQAPGNWNHISTYSPNQAVLIIARDFSADEYELAQLMRFAREGNHVFIAARSLSEETQKFFGISSDGYPFEEYLNDGTVDSLQVQLEEPSFSDTSIYVYPGRRFEGWLSDFDEARTIVLGRNEKQQPNFIRMNAGKGSFYIHLAPLVFSNYFILHKNNAAYFQQLLSVMPGGIEKLSWNEYYLARKVRRPDSNQKSSSTLDVLMRYPAFRYGLLTAMALLLLFIVMEMRRKQRMIPVHARPRNETLDFVKTMGRLYHDKKDHANLARKMGIYFLEHVRTYYKIPTHDLHEEFLRTLQFKSGYDAEELRSIIVFIQQLQMQQPVSEKQLADFHRQLELFYQTT